MDEYLDRLYDTLDFNEKSLLTVSESPCQGLSVENWMEKGEWLSAANRAGANKVFFVENNPIAVFAKCGLGTYEKEKTYNRIWCLGRPRILFLASPGELSVIDLAQKPIDLSKVENNAERPRLKLLETVSEINEISQKLQDFHREHIESGRIFGDNRFGNINNRADKALIRDLKSVRRELMEHGLAGEKLKYAHALIGRSIFIRYLEDRKIISKDYFYRLANKEHAVLLNADLPSVGYDAPDSYYAKVLSDKAFTYGLFNALAKDFNGDMFPNVCEEEKFVTQEHLNLVQGLLYGDVGIQMRLFFYSYRFDIIPLDLISSIYEEFYDSSANEDKKKGKARLDGAYYTPPVLAEFTVSQVLTQEELEKKPRILDPACGSGIFLVEAYRRIVRHNWYKNNKRPDFGSLNKILKTQIAGIEKEEEAARVAAFSLYLAMLHYLEPPDITKYIEQGNRLPNLLVSENDTEDDFQCIWVGNAFNMSAINKKTLWGQRFGDGQFDIIISNPPWGSDDEVMLKWVDDNKKIISNNDSSQSFLWKYLDLLKNGGKVAALIPTAVLIGFNAQIFRKKWMDAVKIEKAFNFSHVRKFFFKGAINPFVLLVFSNKTQEDQPVVYWSAKQIVAFNKTQAILFSKYDMHYLFDEDLAAGDLWKTYYFGRYYDRKFVKWLQSKTCLELYLDKKNTGLGYRNHKKVKVNEKLKELETLTSLESSYERLELEPSPEKLENYGAIGAYYGMRVLVKEGIKEKGLPKGRIIAQFSDEAFSFCRKIYGLKLLEQSQEKYKVLLGILWSSLARYYFFMTCYYWGNRDHKLLITDIYNLPVVFEHTHLATPQIIRIVDNLRSYHPPIRDLYNLDGIQEDEISDQRKRWEQELDEAVFNLYGLNEEQKDLVRDFCDITLPFFYEPLTSKGSTTVIEEENCYWLKENYIDVFVRRWNAFLDEGTEMRAQVHLDKYDTMIAVEFFPADKDDLWDLYNSDFTWKDILFEIGENILQQISISQVMLDGIIHIVSDASILIIKRNEKRFWTRSLAREDADVTLHKYMCSLTEEGACD